MEYREFKKTKLQKCIAKISLSSPRMTLTDSLVVDKEYSYTDTW